MLQDDEACRRAYQAHGPELYGFCLRRLGDSGAAEDAVQEVFVRAWRHGARFDPSVATLRTWLFAIARNVVVDAQRARASRPALALVEASKRTEPSVADHADRVLLAMQLRQALDRLSPDQRVAVEQIAIRGRSSREVAEQLATSESTVRSRLLYGLRRLRAAMPKEEGVHVR